MVNINAPPHGESVFLVRISYSHRELSVTMTRTQFPAVANPAFFHRPIPQVVVLSRLTELGLFAASAWGGFSDAFTFTEVGKDYRGEIPYLILRSVSVGFGSLIPPVVYHILMTLNVSSASSFMVGLLLVLGE